MSIRKALALSAVLLVGTCLGTVAAVTVAGAYGDATAMGLCYLVAAAVAGCYIYILKR